MQGRPEAPFRTRVAAAVGRLHGRYARTFWTLHSIWALLTGAAVLVLAHNRYGFLPWVVLFLALTWASTLFFSRLTSATRSRAVRFAQGFVSYLTRVMYQETLFFLIPFYSYSATFPSWNATFVVALAVLAVLSCIDLFFDRLLRLHRAVAMAFFAVVTFAALNFFVPVLLHIEPHRGSYLAAGLSFLAAIPLAYPLRALRRPAVLARLLLALLAVIGVVRLLRPVVPPVPLRLVRMTFTTEFDTATLRIDDAFPGALFAEDVRGRALYAVATVFSPADLPTAVTFRLYRDGVLTKTSRAVEITAHERGFRVWDAYASPTGRFAPGTYTAELWTREGQLVGRGSVRLLR